MIHYRTELVLLLMLLRSGEPIFLPIISSRLFILCSAKAMEVCLFWEKVPR